VKEKRTEPASGDEGGTADTRVKLPVGLAEAFGDIVAARVCRR
jgi:hypothetical protein